MDLNSATFVAAGHTEPQTAVMAFADPPSDRMTGRPSLTRRVQASRGNLKPAKTEASLDEMLNQAIYQAKISSGESGRIRAAWAADPVETRKFLESLGLYGGSSTANPDPTPGTIVKAEARFGAEGLELYPSQHLTPEERARIVDVYEGKPPRGVVHGGL